MKPIRDVRMSTQQILRSVFLFVLLVGVLWYSTFQARNFLSGPRITLLYEPPIVQEERAVLLQGTTENITALTLNGRQIFTDEEGVFKKTLVLENGYTIMTLRAKDRFGRIRSLSRPFVYTPALDTR